MGLNFLARGTYQRQLGQDWLTTMAQPTISRQLNRFAAAFQSEFLAEWVKFPTEKEKELNKRGYALRIKI